MLSWQASLSSNGRQGVGTATAVCFRGCVQSFSSSSSPSFTPPSIITESCYDFSLSAQCRRQCRRDRTSPIPYPVSFSSLPPMVVNDDKITDRSDCLGGGRRLHQNELVPSRESSQPAYSASRVSSPDPRRQRRQDSSSSLCLFLPSVGVVSSHHNSELLTLSPHQQQQLVFGCQSPDFPCPSRCQQQQQEPSPVSCLNELVPMVALDCELPLSGRLSPPSDHSALPSHFLPAVSSSTAAHRSDISGLTAASVVDSVHCPVTGTSVTMSSSFSRAAVSSSSHGVSSSIYRSAAVSSSPFQQEEAAPLGHTNNSLADLSDSPAAGQILPLVTTASPCLPAVSSSSSACCEGSEAFECSVTMSATFSQAISSSNVDVDSHHHLLEPTSLPLPRLTPLARSSRKRRFSHCREDADNAVSASGLEVHNGLKDKEEVIADDIVTYGRCGEECGGQHEESPSKRLRLQEETEASSSHAVETNDVECVGLDSVVETDGVHSSENAVIEEEDGQMDFSVQTSVEEEGQMNYGVQTSVDVTAMDSDITVTPGGEHTPAVAVEATESFVVGQSTHGLLEEEADSVVEVDVVGVDNTADSHSADYDHHNHHNYHHQPNPDIPEAEHESHKVNIMMMHREDVSACMDTTEHCCGGGVGGGGGGVSENSSEDGENDADNDDDDSAFFYPSPRPHRISPFLNTPKQRKEERRKILKLSIHKMRAVEDPEHFLRRSVLINNTMKRLQRELREEKLRNSPRRGCYGLYRRASALHYDVLNNSYLLHDEPFTVGESDRITDDMTDALVTRLEATTTTSPFVVPTPSPAPCPVDEPDTSSADFPSVSSSSEEVSTSSMTSCSLGEPASELSADLTSSSLSEPPCTPMSESLALQSDHHYSQHNHHHHHHHESQVPDLMPSLATESEALSSTSLSDLSSPVSSLSSSSSQHSSSQAGVLCEGVFGVQSVVREAQSSSTSCSSESQREKQLYADIDTVFNLIHALGDS
ncbi:uncharacterized protein [Littorina saxatilis]|uniref:SERTA domain-containing protein n=1 Tax=Littorina saxatilis TaxID=31220 RepID=A0AAN9GD03_9CAEN